MIEPDATKGSLFDYVGGEPRQKTARSEGIRESAGYVPENDKQRLLDWAWEGYKVGQISADHTAREVFEETVGNLMDFITGT